MKLKESIDMISRIFKFELFIVFTSLQQCKHTATVYMCIRDAKDKIKQTQSTIDQGAACMLHCDTLMGKKS